MAKENEKMQEEPSFYIFVDGCTKETLEDAYQRFKKALTEKEVPNGNKRRT